MKQTGKLTSEQFALAMWLIQQKLSGSDPPAALTNEMIPPTMRPKPSNEPSAAVQPAKPAYSNPELQMVADEIEVLNADIAKLEAEIMQNNNEMQNLQTDIIINIATLSSTLRQLEHQKGAAQQCLDDLGNQAYVGLGQFLVLKKNKELFIDWLKDTCGANTKQAGDCHQCLSDWCEEFL